MKSLDNKIALVTGGSRGIGAAIVKRLAAEGAAVAFTYATAAGKAREVKEAVEQNGGKALAIEANNEDAAAIRAAVERTVAEWGHIDILVNNAGVFIAGPLEQLTLEEIDRTINVNIRAVFLAVQAAAPHLREGGRVISIGSCLADRVAGENLSLYAMSKSALSGLTRGLARDLGKRGITVNLVHPGPTDTDMNPANGDHADGQRRLMAIPEYGSADHVASMVAWLAGEEARSVTSAFLNIDGGTNA